MRYMNQKTEPKNLIETVPLKGYEPSQEKKSYNHRCDIFPPVGCHTLIIRSFIYYFIVAVFSIAFNTRLLS